MDLLDPNQSSSSSDTATSSSSAQEFHRPRSTIEQERTSSETGTIFTIYSMYGDSDPRASWSAPQEDSKEPFDIAYYDIPPKRSSANRISTRRPSSAHTNSSSHRESSHTRRHSARISRSRPPSNYQTPECQLSPVPASHTLSPPTLSPWSSSLTPPSQPYITPPTSPLKSPLSQVSLVPSDGEEPDAFHVRSTYAQLEAQGVKGDGYEEGVERTRARLGTSRASEIRAEQALDDGNEKSRELSSKEIETLSSLDRYGFFTVPSHDRLVRLSSAPLAKFLTPVSAGPSTTPPNAPSLSSLPVPTTPAKEAERIEKWGRMLEPKVRDKGGNIEAWGIRASKEHKLRERTYKGIPDRWRIAAWEILMSRFAKTGKTEMQRLSDNYREALDRPSTYDVQIDLDVPRTISGHIMFRTRYGAGQRSLFHVLHSFSLRCETCGYVQGMGPIAATLLCYVEPQRVYASLVRLHDVYSMHSIFSPGFPGLLEAIYVQERITELMMPDVHAAFKKHMISTTSYATKWYITLFANSVPFQTQLRLWDVFLLEGHDVFVAVAIAIVWVFRDHITSASANFETVLSLLSSFFVPEDENALLSWIEKMLADKKLRANMSGWREKWRGLVARGEEGTALL